MKDITKKIFLFWALTISLCSIFPFLKAQSALPVSSLTPPINDSLAVDSVDKNALLSMDGPYLFRNKKRGKILRVVPIENAYELVEEKIEIDESTHILCVVDNKDKDSFTVPLMKQFKIPKSTYKQPEKLLSISDIEGNFNAFYGLLVANGVMDKEYNWTYGKGHLVLNGDFVDRGKNVTPVLWLIYKLEQEAKKHGGMVHFILGNHEVLDMTGMTDYVDKKYIKLAKKYSGKTDTKDAFLDLMADNQELVKWMKSKNVMEKIGNTLFVHGGISPELVNARLHINYINQTVRNRLMHGPSNNESDKMDEDFLFATHGPLWFRGLAVPYRRSYKKSTPKQVKRAIRHFHVDHISIGHTVAMEVSLDYEGSVIRTDVKHGMEKVSKYSQGLLIENGTLYRVNAKGEKMKL